MVKVRPCTISMFMNMESMINHNTKDIKKLSNEGNYWLYDVHKKHIGKKALVELVTLVIRDSFNCNLKVASTVFFNIRII